LRWKTRKDRIPPLSVHSVHFVRYAEASSLKPIWSVCQYVKKQCYIAYLISLLCREVHGHKNS
jgi:hypothetical protein